MTSIREVILALPGIALTVLCWGMYGPVLHKGQGYLDNDRLKPLICVGAAYFIVAIIIPVLALSAMGKLGGGWRFSGISWSMAAGCGGIRGLGHYSGADQRREADLRDAAGFRRGTDRQRAGLDVLQRSFDAGHGGQASLLPGRSGDGRDRSRDGVDFRTQGSRGTGQANRSRRKACSDEARRFARGKACYQGRHDRRVVAQDQSVGV